MRRLLFAGTLMLGLLLAACGGGTAPTTTAVPTSSPTASAEGAASVTIQGFAFSPAEITVRAGDTVTWTNRDAVTHTVTQEGMGWNSGDVRGGQSYSKTFDTVGIFDYFCLYHTYMKGRVIVE
jgi:plastocyanin